MVGVVGSSPIAPTIDCRRPTRDRTGMVMTPRTRTETLLDQDASSHVRRCGVCDEKVRLARTFLFSGVSPCPPSRLPDGAVKRFDAPVTVAEVAAVDRPRPRQGRARRQGRRQARRHVATSSTATPTLAIVTDKDAEGLDVLRHSTAHLLALRGEGAVPRRAGDDRPGDRGRLLLRLRVQAPVHARGPRGDREADGRAREEATSRSCAR